MLDFRPVNVFGRQLQIPSSLLEDDLFDPYMIAQAAAEGIETVTSLLPNLTEVVREGRTRDFADITYEEDPEDDEQMVVEGDVLDVRLGRPDSQLEPELNAPANSNASSRSARSETHAEPEAEASTRPARTWRLESVIAGFDFEMRER